MDSTERFADLALAWAMGDAAAALPASIAAGAVRRVILVEGVSDRAALEAVAARLGRWPSGGGVEVVPMGGAMNIGRFLAVLGPAGLDLELGGLCDVGEEPFFRKHLRVSGLGPFPDRASLEAAGFYVCEPDLEDEMIRSLSAESAIEVIADEGDLKAFRIFQRQPYQRSQTVEQQLHRFFGTLSGRKERYGAALAGRLDLATLPHPIKQLLSLT